MAERNWSLLGWAVVLIGWAVWYFINGYQRMQDLDFKEPAAVIAGLVTNAWGGGDDMPEAEYEFTIDGVRHTGKSYVNAVTRKGESIDVRYVVADPSRNIADSFDGLFQECIAMSVLMVLIGLFIGALGYSKESNAYISDDKIGSFAPTPIYRFWIVVLCMASATMLYMARGSQPYIFFQLLRWLVTGTAAMLCYYSYQWQFTWAPWLYGFVAILFNPFVPFHMSRSSWAIVDLVAAIGLVITTFVVKPPEEVAVTSNAPQFGE